MKKQATERDEVGSNSMDRISDLPQQISQHILSFLSQKEAVQTCVLSKSWRYLWIARPIIEFRESFFKRNTKTLYSVLDKTLRRYQDENHYLQEFVFEKKNFDSKSNSLLEKWIPIIVQDKNFRTLRLCFISECSEYFDLPLAVFKAESLQNLYLENCQVSRINSVDKVLFKHLQTISLHGVYIMDDSLEKTMSNCPLIEYVDLYRCGGLTSIRMNKCPNLKNFDFCNVYLHKAVTVNSIEIEAPALESIKIVGCPNWFGQHSNYFPRLKSLYLDRVQLTKNSIDSFSSEFPYLEVLNLNRCHGFKEFHLSNRFIKHLTIDVEGSIKAHVDATNIRYFKFSGPFVPSIFFTTTISSECKSDITLFWSHAYLKNEHTSSSWFLKLNELFKALCQSEITLQLFEHYYDVYDQQVTEVIAESNCMPPLVVELFMLTLHGHSSSSLSSLINGLFQICRPRCIGPFCLYTVALEICEREKKNLTDFLCKIFVTEREMRQYFWQQDLEKVSVEASNNYGEDWHLTNFSELLKKNKDRPNKIIRFKLKWRNVESSPTPS